MSLINAGNGIIGIDYGEMNKARSHLKRAIDASTELNRRINSAINKLQVDQGSSRIKMATEQLRAYSRQITRMQSEMDKEINKMDRAVRRFKEVDSACAARIRAIGGDESEKKESFFEEVEDKIEGVIGFGEEELESAKNKVKGEWEEYKEDDPIGAGKILGTYDFVKDIIIGPVRIVDEKVKEFSSDPVGTIKRWAPYIWKFKTGDFIGAAVSYVTSHAEIKNAPKVIMNNIVNEFDEKFVKGDMLTKSRYITNLKLNIASLFVGGGEFKAASEIGDIDKLGEVSEVTNVGDEINNINKIDDGIGNAEELSSIIKESPTIDDAILKIKNSSIESYDSKSITKLLNDVNEAKFNTKGKASLKSEILQKCGFVNFDRDGSLADVLAFKDMNIEVIELKNPITLYRRGYPGEPTSSYGLGRWWSDKNLTIEQVRDELAVCESWGNPLEGEYNITVPAGTRVIKGIAEKQIIKNSFGEVIESRAGGATQYWVNDIDNIWLK